MTPNTPARMVVVKKEEKELKLRQLVLDGLAALAQSSGSDITAPVKLCLVAQSSLSPVARAVTALNAELVAARVIARIIITKVETGPHRQIGQDCTYRHLSDVRCYDAHELLVLGSTVTWIGDCLRRDPAVRDSYELHTVACAQTAKLVGLSFEKLWQLAAPFDASDERAALAMAADLAGLPADASSRPTALTRH